MLFLARMGEDRSNARADTEDDRGLNVLIDWCWYKELTDEQRSLYDELLQIETEIGLSPHDCKELVISLTRIGIRTPQQLREWFKALAEAEND